MTKHAIQFEEQGHRYTVDGRWVPSVTQVLEASGRIDLRGIPGEVLRRAAERGTRVHQAAALLLRGELEWSSVDESIGGYVRALDAFLRRTGFEAVPASIERPLYCEQYDFCGTPDVEGLYRLVSPFGNSGRKVLATLDWKSGMMAAVRYQLAAYAHQRGICHRAAVKLNSDGTFRMEWFPPETQRHDLAVFLKDLDDTRKAGRWAA